MNDHEDIMLEVEILIDMTMRVRMVDRNGISNILFVQYSANLEPCAHQCTLGELQGNG